MNTDTFDILPKEAIDAITKVEQEKYVELSSEGVRIYHALAFT